MFLQLLVACRRMGVLGTGRRATKAAEQQVVKLVTRWVRSTGWWQQRGAAATSGIGGAAVTSLAASAEAEAIVVA